MQQARIKKPRERKPTSSTPKPTGSQLASAERYLSGRLIYALSKGDRHWRPIHGETSPDYGSGGAFRLLGVSRPSYFWWADSHVLRFKAHATLLGAEGGAFKLERTEITLTSDNLQKAMVDLRAEGLCCICCAEARHYHMRSDYERDPCAVQKLLDHPAARFGMWITTADNVQLGAGIPSEFGRIATLIFKRATWRILPEDDGALDKI